MAYVEHGVDQLDQGLVLWLYFPSLKNKHKVRSIIKASQYIENLEPITLKYVKNNQYTFHLKSTNTLLVSNMKII